MNNKLNPALIGFQDQSDENISTSRLSVFYPWKNNKNSEIEKSEVLYQANNTNTGLNNGQSMPSSNSSSSPCTSPISSNNSITSIIHNTNVPLLTNSSHQPNYYMNHQQHDYHIYMQSNQYQQNGHILPPQYTDRHFLNKALMDGYPQIDSTNNPSSNLVQNTWWEQQGGNVSASNWNPSHNFTNLTTPTTFSHESVTNYGGNHGQTPQHHFQSSQHIDYHQPYSQLFSTTSSASSVMAAYHHQLSKNLSSKNFKNI